MPNTDAFEIKFTVKEDGVGDAFLEIEWMKMIQGNPDNNSMDGKILFLRFAKKTTFDQAQLIAREMNSRFGGLSVLNL